MKKFFLPFCSVLFFLFSCKKEIIIEKEITFQENGVIWPGVYLSKPVDILHYFDLLPIAYHNVREEQINGIKLEHTGPKKLYFVKVDGDGFSINWYQQIEEELLRRGYKMATLGDLLGMINEYSGKFLADYCPITFLKGPEVDMGQGLVELAGTFYYDENYMANIILSPKKGIGWYVPARILVYR